MAVGDIKAEMVQVIRVTRVIGTGTEKDPVRTEVQYWEPNGKLIVKKDWQGDMSQKSMKELPEIDMERMKELLRSEPLTCIHEEEPKGVQENIDAVICVMSKMAFHFTAIVTTVTLILNLMMAIEGGYLDIGMIMLAVAHVSIISMYIGLQVRKDRHHDEP